MKKKLQHVQRTVSLTAGDSQKEVSFSDINGPVVGYSSKLIGAIPAGESADISILDGASTVLMPLDASFSEVTTKHSFRGAIVPLTIENPGRIKAIVTPSSALPGGVDYKVKITIFYAVELSQYNSPSINDCL